MSKHITKVIFPDLDIDEPDYDKLEDEFFCLASKDKLEPDEQKRIDFLESMLIDELWTPEIKLITDGKVVVAEA